jgi:hypothetical protein
MGMLAISQARDEALILTNSTDQRADSGVDKEMAIAALHQSRK